MAYRRIVVGTDGSDTATLAVRHAAELAAASGATLTVVTGFTPDPATERARAEAPEEVRWRISDSVAADEKAGKAMRLATDIGVATVESRTASGDPADILIDTATDVGADVIVVGSKGMASPTRFILGSVPNKVSHHAPCDVLIVHTAD